MHLPKLHMQLDWCLTLHYDQIILVSSAVKTEVTSVKVACHASTAQSPATNSVIKKAWTICKQIEIARWSRTFSAGCWRWMLFSSTSALQSAWKTITPSRMQSYPEQTVWRLPHCSWQLQCSAVCSGSSKYVCSVAKDSRNKKRPDLAYRSSCTTAQHCMWRWLQAYLQAKYWLWLCCSKTWCVDDNSNRNPRTQNGHAVMNLAAWCSHRALAEPSLCWLC